MDLGRAREGGCEVTARATYHAQRKAYRIAEHQRERDWNLSGIYADGNAYFAARDAYQTRAVPPKGYGRRIIDPLIVRRAALTELAAIKPDYETCGCVRRGEIHNLRRELYHRRSIAEVRQRESDARRSAFYARAMAERAARKAAA